MDCGSWPLRSITTCFRKRRCLARTISTRMDLSEGTVLTDSISGLWPWHCHCNLVTVRLSHMSWFCHCPNWECGQSSCNSLVPWVVGFALFRKQNIPAHVYLNSSHPSSKVGFCNSLYNTGTWNIAVICFYILPTITQVTLRIWIFTFSPFSRHTPLVWALLEAEQEPFSSWASVGRQEALGIDASAPPSTSQNTSFCYFTYLSRSQPLCGAVRSLIMSVLVMQQEC